MIYSKLNYLLFLCVLNSTKESPAQLNITGRKILRFLTKTK